MNKFLKIITGAAAREKKWMETPTCVPDAYKNERPGSDYYIMSREFFEPDQIYSRIYCAAVRMENGKWEIRLFGTDVRDGATFYQREGACCSPLEVVQALASYERMLIGKGFICVPNMNATYPVFAARHSIHFDDAGSPYIPAAKDMQTRKVILSGTVLKDAFKKSDKKQHPLNTWENLCLALKEKWEMTDQKIKSVSPEMIADLKSWLSDAERNAKTLFRIWPMGPDYGPHEKLEYAVAASALVLYIDAMAIEYARASTEGVSASFDVLKRLDAKFEEYVPRFISSNLHMSYTEAQQMKDIIYTGTRPSTVLPIETIIERYDVLMAEKNNPSHNNKQPPLV